MNKKLSERTVAEEIVNRWIAAFRDDLSGKNARERLVDLIHAALEQQLVAKDAEIAAAQAALREILWESQRLCQIYGINHSGYRGWLRDRIAALAETPAAPEVK